MSLGLGALWDQLVYAVCRPPRDDAYTDNELVGGRRASFRYVGACVQAAAAPTLGAQGALAGPAAASSVQRYSHSLVSENCRLYDRKYYRQDLQLTNGRGQKLQARWVLGCGLGGQAAQTR